MNTSEDIKFVRDALVVVEFYLREKNVKRQDVVNSASLLEEAMAALLKVSATMQKQG